MINELDRLKQLAGISEADIVNLGDRREKKKHNKKLVLSQKRHLDVISGKLRIVQEDVYEFHRFLEVGKRITKIDLPEIEERTNELKKLLQEMNTLLYQEKNKHE